jgi:hypothetical protein
MQRLPLRLRVRPRRDGLDASVVGHPIVELRVEVKVKVKLEVKLGAKLEVKVVEKVEVRVEEKVEERNVRRERRGIAIAVGAIATETVATASGEMDGKARKTGIGGVAENVATRDERGVRGSGLAMPRINPTATLSDGAS